VTLRGVVIVLLQLILLLGKIEYYEFLKYWRQFNDKKHVGFKGKFVQAVGKVSKLLTVFSTTTK
jgi:hypothetical protein